MRQSARVDTNQKEIVDALRDVGASVLHLHQVGGGCPDLCIGYRGENYLFEIKDGAKSPSRQRLTRAEQRFFDEWRGTVNVICSVDEALTIIGAIEEAL